MRKSAVARSGYCHLPDGCAVEEWARSGLSGTDEASPPLLG
nr:DUF333 domain-containing protein [Paracoccus laeviglucosivorans]